jgi:hypothetical protein
MVDVGDRQERLGHRTHGGLRGGGITGKRVGGGQELFFRDRGAAAGDMRQVQFAPDPQIDIDDLLLGGRLRGVAEGRGDPLAHQHVVVFGELAISVRVQVIEPMTDLGDQQVRNRHEPSTDTAVSTGSTIAEPVGLGLLLVAPVSSVSTPSLLLDGGAQPRCTPGTPAPYGPAPGGAHSGARSTGTSRTAPDGLSDSPPAPLVTPSLGHVDGTTILAGRRGDPAIARGVC